MRELSLENCRLDKRYDVLRHLGRGSYAEIYLARDILSSPQSPHNLVVIKALNVFLQDDLDPDLERTLVENFQNEAIALDRVRHPNIVSRLGHGTARDLGGTVFHYLVLEYLPGGDLQKLIKHQRIAPKTALDYLEQVCAGVKHAHDRGVIHRDLKPQNLLLTADEKTVKVTDFGVARFSHADSPITRVGTNVYAPPEHSPLAFDASGVMTVAKLTPAADIYSLAKTAYMLVTGESPRFFINQPITDLPADSRGEDWSDEFLSVITHATQSRPDDRYQNIDEFWAALSGVRQIVEEGDFATAIRRRPTEEPQAHVSAGYSPVTPMQPRFNTSRDLRERFPALEIDPRKTSTYSEPLRYDNVELAEPTGPGIRLNTSPEQQGSVPDYLPPQQEETPAVRRKRRFLSKAAAVVLFIAVLGGLLYGTHEYLKHVGVFSNLGITVAAQTATANTDVHLRRGPNPDYDVIGVVTKNSKVRIVNSQNNWYQVDVISQGQPGTNQAATGRGWLNGKYLDLD